MLTILNDIKEQTGYGYFYNRSIGLDYVSTSMSVTDMPIEAALKQLFSDLPYHCAITNRTIVITSKAVAKNNDVSSPARNENIATVQSDNILKGNVVSEAGTPIDHLVIMEAQTHAYTYTNKNGSFSLPVQQEGSIICYGDGFVPQKIKYSGVSSQFFIKMAYEAQNLDSVTVESVSEKKDPTKFVNLDNRRYMNLGQVLQGTIPGLTLQISNSSSKQVTGIEVHQHYDPGTTINVDNYITMSLDDFYAAKGKQQGQAIVNALLKDPNAYTSVGGVVLYKLITTTVFGNTLIPQLRGANSFSSSTTSMLIVIDGFPQDNFPADYPMADVESVEVIRDPKELVKWGASAAGGIIYIKTKSAQGGTPKFNYTTSFYYQPAPKFSEKKLMLSNTSDYLDYVKNFFDSTGGKTRYNPKSYNLSPALRLLVDHANSTITDDQFNNSWDSLKAIDNESQMGLLQQNAFLQNHILSVTGGNLNYKFIAIGSYSSSPSNALKSSSKTVGLKLNNQFNLLNNNLKINWLINYSDAKSRTGYSFDPNNTLEPYQLLVDANGNYVYDNSDLNQSANDLIQSYGYKNYGINILQDARVNKNTSDLKQLQSNFRMNWDLPAGFKWAASVIYTGKKTTTDLFYDKQSSYVRRKVDNYAELENGSLVYYLPYGNIFNETVQKSSDLNVRSALSWSKTFGLNKINLSFGGGGASVIARKPSASTIYGYNTKTKTGIPVFLPSPDPTVSIENYNQLFPGYSAVVTPYSLLTAQYGDSTASRSLNWNAAVGYNYGDRFSITGSINNSLNPVYGQENTYSVLSNYNMEASGLLIQNDTHGRFFHSLSASAGFEGMKMPDLLVGYSSQRYLQSSDWGNYTIWVNGLNPTQQKGQKTLNVYQKLSTNLLDSSFIFDLAYNTLKTDGTTGTLSGNLANSGTDTSYTQRYVSAELQINLRKGNLNLDAKYSKSPEGQKQFNGAFTYNIANESYFHNKSISTLLVNGLWEDISPYQALGLMMGTNVASGGSYSNALNNTFNELPPSNLNKELHFALGFRQDDYLLDLRYYHHRTSNLNNNTSSYSDPATGLSSQVTYSTIINKGIEFLLKTTVIKNKSFNYIITLNGAYNQNIASLVPYTAFSATSNYPTTYRSGYGTSNIWSFKWAGLNDEGEPQVYDAKGNKTSTLDSATLSNAMVYSGVTSAPWTGGFIQEFNYKQFFARISLVFNWDYVMRMYLPAMDQINDRSVWTKDRWQKPGDENHTDIAKIINSGGGTYRSFVIQNSSNSILSADNIRLQEVMIGWMPKAVFLKRHFGINSFQITLSAENPAIWTKNKYHIDPSTIGGNGKIGLPIARQYVCNINIGF
ncbi:TonB-dependent receptor plug domain-containing protein [Arachidicoccus ginsenosidimutans]|uniref:TonB-dependent receptor plug domain-containing protein n=1 Tax=Arachidicoccus sp. BS20 TaxID=1850526 RepID=UPI0018D2B027|nr:TonB-dependent receptor plug domain-containing protein [Arachidicoccus sp. BS20]